MKKIFPLIFLSVALLLSACVEESPEPVYVPTETHSGERVVVSNDTAGGIHFALYSDDTCEITGLDEDYDQTTLTIPDVIENCPVVAICDEAFSNANLSTVTIPEGVKSIGKKAFQRTRISSIVIPDSVLTIGESIFNNCLFLEKVTLSKNLKEIPLAAFDSCSRLEEIQIPEGVTAIGEEAFGGCTALKSLSLPSTLKRIDPWAFWRCSFQTVTVPAAVKEIGAHAFRETPWLKSVTQEFFLVGDGVLLDYNGTAQSVTLPGTVKYLSNAFYATPVLSVTVPETLEGVCENPFEDSSVTEKIYLGNSEAIRNALK